MKRFFFLLALVCFALNASADSWTDDNGVVWTYTVSGDNATITKANPAKGNLVCPQIIAGYQVTSIGGYAFNSCISLTSITLPEGVTSIGDGAFYDCTSLTSITLPEGVTSIGSSVFFDCTSLTSITLPEGVTSIGDGAFTNCVKLTSINIPEGVTSIGSSTFSCCSGLTSITIPEGVTSIGESAFWYCSNLTSITMPNGITSIGKNAFYNCSNLTSITIPNSISIESGAFDKCSKVAKININISNPSVWSNQLGSLPDVPRHIFKDGDEIEELVLPEGIDTIGNYAFRYCSNLTSITLPESVTTIGQEAFKYCFKLASITIPESVTSIGAYAFKNCAKLTSITIPYRVTTIGNGAFYGCSVLTDITLPNNLTSIGNETFYNCSTLTTITLPDSVSTIGQSAFWGCSKLTSITIPNGITSIGQSAFYNCTDLSVIYINITNPRVWSNQFGNLPEVPRYIYKDGKEVKDMVLPEGIKAISSYAFQKCYHLTSVTLPNSVTSISSYAFQDCPKLTSVTLPKGITSLGSYTFYKCSNLTSITLPDSITNISNNTFDGCSSLSSIVIPNKVSSISSYAFQNCSKLTSITLPDGLKSVGYYAFYGCSSLASITLPDGVTSIGGYAFYSCSSLTSFIIPNNVTSIGTSVFEKCSKLTSITLPNNPSIGIDAFYSCPISDVNVVIVNPQETCSSIGYALKGDKDLKCRIFQNGVEIRDLVVPEGLKSIPNYAYNNCSNLTSITLPNSVKSIGEYAFNNCSDLTALTIPDGLTSIGNYAFNGCSHLNILTLPNTPPTIGSNNLRDDMVYFIPTDAMDTYKSASVWSDFSIHFVASDSESSFDVNTVAKENSSGLHQAIGEENMQNVVSLKISGTINSYDILVIRNKMKNLKYLDLTDAVIVPSSFYYLEDYSTTSNTISPKMFSNLYLISVKLPENINKIDESAFAGCSSLRELEINSDLEEIGASAFQSTSINNLFIRKCNTLGMNAFNSANMSMLRIGDVDSIGYDAFGSSTIDSLIIEKVSTFGTNPDNYSQKYGIGRSMKSNYVEIHPTKNANILLPPYSFYDSSIKEVVLNKGFFGIGSGAFAGYKFGSSYRNERSLQKISLPEGFQTIDNNAFLDCFELQTITFPSTLTHIGESAFSGCSSLKEIRLPFLTKLGDGAFDGCTSLKEVKLPSSLESIGNSAFAGCDSIESVYTYTLEPISIGTSTFSQKCFQNATLYVPETSYYTYYFNTEWSQFQHLTQFSDTYDYFYLDRDYLIDDETGVIKGNPDADLNSESGLIVQSKQDVQTLGTIVMQKMEDGTSASIIAEADNIVIDTLTVQLNVEAGKWIFYTPAKDVPIADADYPGQYVWYDYDGEQRAQSGTGWAKLPSDGVLQAGRGYILQSDVAGTVTLHYSKPTFGEDKEVELKTFDSENVADANWNLTGNPFTSYYDMVDEDYDAPIITWNVKAQNYEAFRPGDDDCHLQPGQAFFVQKVTETSTVSFNTARRETYTESQQTAAAQVKARRQRGINPSRSIINLTLSGDYTVSDHTRVVLNEKATAGYDLGSDAPKFLSQGAKSQLFSLDSNGSQYAINERPAGDIALGYIAAEEGTMTISAPRMDRRMMLLDRETNVTHDLSGSDYVFSTKAGRFTNRFVLYMPAVPTDIARLESETGVAIGTQTGGISVGNAEGRTIMVYTLNGQLMGTHSGNGFIGLPHGVYVIKVDEASAKVAVK
ncbi:MAG: leucine-rich repeat domain-containing protein [Bacteroidaceae bacterium]|nr:leucine-rich repeat domain-containing protein [Bacteroidaceae bacterium]